MLMAVGWMVDSICVASCYEVEWVAINVSFMVKKKKRNKTLSTPMFHKGRPGEMFLGRHEDGMEIKLGGKYSP